MKNLRLRSRRFKFAREAVSGLWTSGAMATVEFSAI
jgi:hypothetical protein